VDLTVRVLEVLFLFHIESLESCTARALPALFLCAMSWFKAIFSAQEFTLSSLLWILILLHWWISQWHDSHGCKTNSLITYQRTHLFISRPLLTFIHRRDNRHAAW
jgi:hypothetical protein